MAISARSGKANFVTVMVLVISTSSIARSAYRIQDRVYACPIELGLSVISGKWKLLIVCRLRNQTLRHGTLHRLLPGVSQKVLTQQLRELEADGIVARTMYAVVPPQVEYQLTPAAQGLLPLLDTLAQWGLHYTVTEER